MKTPQLIRDYHLISSILKKDTRVILVSAADISGILIQLGHTENTTNICGKNKYAANICGIHVYDLFIFL